eukprot:TRINITY_DN8662_c0_g2_i1.p1 TRINITY_DN8662_c0_g2~~TRINITY_DN8662_c0_g2_i1.p1  ORF type:complete len:244 (+),score=26.57 TRINITY_DN8662_c0_g2_i1:61-792(+)
MMQESSGDASEMDEDELDEMIHACFQGHNLDMLQGFVLSDPRELNSLVTNLLFRLELMKTGPEIDAALASVHTPNQMSVVAFTSWLKQDFVHFGPDSDDAGPSQAAADVSNLVVPHVGVASSSEAGRFPFGSPPMCACPNPQAGQIGAAGNRRFLDSRSPATMHHGHATARTRGSAVVGVDFSPRLLDRWAARWVAGGVSAGALSADIEHFDAAYFSIAWAETTGLDAHAARHRELLRCTESI